jgi:hypothetical protein
MAQFSTGLGHDKVFSGEYELFNNIDSEIDLSRDNFTNVGLVPGMNITMAIIIGQYGESGRCPRTDCKSRSFIDGAMGGNPWYVQYCNWPLFLVLRFLSLSLIGFSWNNPCI